MHAALVLSTRLFSISLWPSMCSVQQVVSLSMSTKYLCVLGRFLHVTYLYRDNITYCVLILIEERICVHFHVMRTKSSANTVVDITGNLFLLALFLYIIILYYYISLLENSFNMDSSCFRKIAYVISWWKDCVIFIDVSN